MTTAADRREAAEAIRRLLAYPGLVADTPPERVLVRRLEGAAAALEASTRRVAATDRGESETR